MTFLPQIAVTVSREHLCYELLGDREHHQRLQTALNQHHPPAFWVDAKVSPGDLALVCPQVNLGDLAGSWLRPTTLDVVLALDDASLRCDITASWHLPLSPWPDNPEAWEALRQSLGNFLFDQLLLTEECVDRFALEYCEDHGGEVLIATDEDGLENIDCKH